jgi:hypothetical protein
MRLTGTASREKDFPKMEGMMIPFDVGNPEYARIVRELDVDAMWEFLKDVGGDVPRSRHAVLVMLHKMRAQWGFRRIYGEGRMRQSKRWLLEHGFSNALRDPKLDAVQSD